MNARWEGRITLTWDFETATVFEADEILENFVNENILKNLPVDVLQKLKVTIDKKTLNKKSLHSHHLPLGGPYDVDELLPKLIANDRKNYLEIVGNDSLKYAVQLDNITKYLCFHRDNCTCQACGIVGTEMYLEQQPLVTSQGFGFLNLYAAYKGQKVLMSMDHILPLSKGGPSILSNLQTYCSLCNTIKGNYYLTNEQVKFLRFSSKNIENDKNNFLADNVINGLVPSEPIPNVSLKSRKQHLVKTNNILNAKLKSQASELQTLRPLVVMKLDPANPDYANPDYQHQAFCWLTSKKLRNKGKIFEAGTVFKIKTYKAGSLVCQKDGLNILIPQSYLGSLQSVPSELISSRNSNEVQIKIKNI